MPRQTPTPKPPGNLLTAVQMAVKTEWHREPDGRRLYLILVDVTCDGPNDQLRVPALLPPRSVSIPTAVFPSGPLSPADFLRCTSGVLTPQSGDVGKAPVTVALLLLLTTLLSTNVSIGHK